MSVTYFLVRVKEPMAKRPLCGLSSGQGDFLPLGPLAGIADRLESALAGLGPVSRTDHPGGPAVNPFTGAPFEMNGKILEQPPHVLLRFQAASRELEAMVHGDPVTSISINCCVPQDFLPLVDALADLAPFAIVSDSSDTAVDPEEYRPRKPRLVEGVFTPLPPLEGVPSGGFLIPRWRLEGRAYFSEAPVPGSRPRHASIKET